MSDVGDYRRFELSHIYGIVAIQLHEHSVDMFMYKSIKKSERVKHFSDGNIYNF